MLRSVRARAELRESLGALEQALAAPARDRADAWAGRVHVALVELSGDFRDHIEITEGPDGLYAESSRPRRGYPMPSPALPTITHRSAA